MTRQRKMIELTLRNLREAATNADYARDERNEHKARLILAVAVDEALADLEHALSTYPCNHGACRGTTIKLPLDGTEVVL